MRRETPWFKKANEMNATVTKVRGLSNTRVAHLPVGHRHIKRSIPTAAAAAAATTRTRPSP